MVTNKFFRIAIVAASSCLLYCCALPNPTIPADPSPHIDHEISPKDVIAILQKRAESITTIKSTLSMTIQSKGMAQPKKLKGLIAICNPGSIRFKGFTFFGLDIFDLVIRDGEFELFLPGKEEFYRGNQQDTDNLPGPLPLFPDDITAIFCGGFYESSDLSCLEDGEHYLISSLRREVSASSRRKMLWVEKEYLRVIAMEVYNGEELDVRYQFDDFKLIEKSYFPFAVEIDRVPDESFMKIMIDSIEVNSLMEPEVFQFQSDKLDNIPTLEKK